MVSYRFCRPDDLLLIAEALNQCYLPHFPGEPAIDLKRLKTEAQEVNLWASSCMIAMVGDNRDLPPMLTVHAVLPRKQLFGRVMYSLTPWRSLRG